MSDVDAICETIAELECLTKTQLIVTLLALYREKQVSIKAAEEQRHTVTHHADRADLFARRCELAVQILRDDEQGLTVARLEEISKVVWPGSSVMSDPTKIPTTIQAGDMTLLLSASALLWRAYWILHSIEESKIQLGELLTRQLERWKSDTEAWRTITGVEKHETDEIRARNVMQNY